MKGGGGSGKVQVFSSPARRRKRLNDLVFLHFEYVFHKLFDLNARDY
jgi:hypothetical protein